MHRLILLFLFFSSSVVYGQHRFGIEAGVGLPAFGIHLMQYDIDHESTPSFTMELNYLRKKTDRRVSLGAKLTFQQYKFDYSYDHQGASSSEARYLKMNCNYLFLSPTIDFGLGKEQNIHFYLSPAIGAFAGGKLYTRVHNDFYMGQGSNKDTTFNTTNNINRVVVHLNLGFKEQVKINELWYVVFNQGFSLVSSNMTTIKVNDKVYEVRTGCYYFQAGFMRKYKRPAKPENTDAPGS